MVWLKRRMSEAVTAPTASWLSLELYKTMLFIFLVHQLAGSIAWDLFVNLKQQRQWQRLKARVLERVRV